MEVGCTSYFHGRQSASSSWLLPSREGAGLKREDEDCHGNEEAFGWKFEGKNVEEGGKFDGEMGLGVAGVREVGFEGGG